MMLKSAEVLKQRSTELLNQPRAVVRFTGVEAADKLLNDIESYPHAFVLGCLMDRQIKAERAWIIPYLISAAVGDFKISSLLAISLEEFEHIFEGQSFHRFNRNMAKAFYLGVQRIEIRYNGNAANIWLDNPSSAKVVRRFLEFYGAGIKIATMAANILARDFKLPMSDHTSIDISPDVHVKRVFERLDYIRMDADSSEIIYAARELNPSYPGIFDLSTWEVGRNWCKPKNPFCNKCYLNTSCPKAGVK